MFVRLVVAHSIEIERVRVLQMNEDGNRQHPLCLDFGASRRKLGMTRIRTPNGTMAFVKLQLSSPDLSATKTVTQ
jgi:hypothetical protein